MFSETLIEHFESPRNVGEMAQPDAEGEDENPVCGDLLHIWLRLKGDTVEEMRWRAEGCAPVIAAASVTSEMVRGMTVEKAGALAREDIAEALGGLPARKAHAALLALSTLRKALASYDRNGEMP